MSNFKNKKVLVSTEWVRNHLNDPGIVIAEVDVDTTADEQGHIPVTRPIPIS